ncbi:RING-type E3 ubiquitin transferase [Sarracenia purpurea var. burkii]
MISTNSAATESWGYGNYGTSTTVLSLPSPSAQFSPSKIPLYPLIIGHRSPKIKFPSSISIATPNLTSKSRAQKCTGATNNVQQRSGNVLPPPADEYSMNGSASSEKPISKSASNNPASSVRGSPPNRYVQSAGLPAAASWGFRASNCRSTSASSIGSNGPSKQKPETCGSMTFSSAVADTTSFPLLHDDVRHKDKPKSLEHFGQYVVTNHRTTASEAPATLELPAVSNMNGQLHSATSTEDKDRCISATPNVTNSFDISRQSYGHSPDKDLNVSANGNVRNLCSDMASINIDKCREDEHSWDARPNSSLSDNSLVNSPQNQGSKQCYPEQFRGPPTSHFLGEAVASTDDICVARKQSDWLSDSVTREQSDWRLDSQTQVANMDSQVAFLKVKEYSSYFEDQRLNDPDVVNRSSYCTNSHLSLHPSNHSRIYSSQENEPYCSTNFKIDPQNLVKKEHLGRSQGLAANADPNAATDMGESSIISNILSMDFDAWDESLTSPQNLAKFLGETDIQQASLKLSSSRKVPSNKSRFSFARQEETRNQVSDVEPSFSNIGPLLKDHPLSHDFPVNKDFSFDMLGDCNSFSTFNITESDNFASSHSHISSNKLSVSRAQISAPPGFSVPSRAPPPGFASHERMEPIFDVAAGNYLLDPSSSLRNSHQAPPTGNVGGFGDIGFLDPAILAVGKGRHPGGLNNAAGLEMRSNFPPPLNTLENEARVQFLMQRPLSLIQNRGLDEMMGNGSSSPTDAYRIPSRIIEQTHSSNLSPFPQFSLPQSRTAPMTNGQWDGWNEVQYRNDVGMEEVLRTEILGV